MSSCSQDEICEKSQTNVRVRLKSNISQSQLNSIMATLDKEVEKCTRANGTYDISPQVAQDALKPMLEDGKQLQSDILIQLEKQEMHNPELLHDIENLKDEELVSLSLINALVQPTTDYDFNDIKKWMHKL